MKLKNQVCTLEQAQKLRELGVIQESLFTYNEVTNSLDIVPAFELHQGVFFLANDWWSAYTVAELGLMLPSHSPSYVHDGRNHSHCQNARVDTFPLIDSGQSYEATPAHELNKEIVPISTGRTEAEARAAMLIHLLGNNLISASEVNKRLSAI